MLAIGDRALSAEKEPEVQPVYFNGRVVQLTLAPGRKHFSIGPWHMAAKVVHKKPEDPHPNLYIVAPGTQYMAENAPGYDHNEVLSTIFVTPEMREWDVYWAIVLDPTLQEDFRSESQLLMATQQGFDPASITLNDMPGAQFLREFLGVDSVEKLQKYRRPDGLLPRLIIVPARVSIKAEATDPQAVPSSSALSQAPKQ